MREADWYFDFLSPFSYLQFMRLEELPSELSLNLRPVLLAALLQHWGQLGPAEIPPKRRFTYRFCLWQAQRRGIPLRMPPAHPFNPLRPLRLAIALGGGPETVGTIFRFIWAEGRNIEDDAQWRELAERLDVHDADARIADPAVKETLRAGTAEAVARGVFGVPTFLVDGELFWGEDATEMVCDYLADPARFHSAEMARANDLPVASARRQ